tara:strand:- start:2143 stop:3393 length:1251 start_codon:yes stop_codon:yes gene_type:complete
MLGLSCAALWGAEVYSKSQEPGAETSTANFGAARRLRAKGGGRAPERQQWRRQKRREKQQLLRSERRRPPLADAASNASAAMRAAVAAATAAPRLEMIEVCFLAMGKPTQVDYAVSIIRNIEAHAASDVRYHMIVDKPPAPLAAQMRQRSVWRGLPMDRVRLQTIADMPSEARTLYKALSKTATGPGPLYLFKPLLHLVLPESVKRVIVLDTDLFLFTNLRGMWDLFGRFDAQQLIGLAQEQCPSYQEVRALGGRGYNGGVQLLHLERMRNSKPYEALMWRHARRQLPMKPGGIGWLGDQTLYSWMSVNGSGAEWLFFELPCGWNRQIGTHMAGWKGFWKAHRCAEPCALLHGNFANHKQFMEALKEDPTGASCRAVVRRFRRNDHLFRDHTPDARMLDMVGAKCCRGGGGGGGGT